MDQTQPTILNGTFNCSKRLDDQDEATLRSLLALDISSCKSLNACLFACFQRSLSEIRFCRAFSISNPLRGCFSDWEHYFGGAGTRCFC